MKLTTAVCVLFICAFVEQFKSNAGQSEGNDAGSGNTPKPPTPHPIAYTCSLDGTVTVQEQGLAKLGNRIAIGPDKNESNIIAYTTDTANCKYGISDITSISTPITLNKCDITNPIYVYVMNQTHPDIVGGRNSHAYELTCNFPAGGIMVTVSAAPVNVNGPDNVTSETQPFDLGSLTMTITPATPHLGDTLNVKISGAHNSYVLPTTCNATGTGTVSPEILVLLTNGTTQDADLLDNFNVATPGVATSNMYAFRFQTSATVSVSCVVTVCKTRTCVPAYNPAPVSRRRRAVENGSPSKTFEVKAAFQIAGDNTDETRSSQSAVRFDPVLMVLTLLCMTIFASRRAN